MRTKWIGVWVVCIVGLLVSCTHINPQPENTNETLESRAQAHWAAKVNQNWSTAYQYFCAKYQEQIPRSDFLKMSKMTINRFTINNIEKAADGTTAAVEVTFSADIRGYEMAGINTKEAWVHEKGNWFVCPESPGFKPLFQ